MALDGNVEYGRPAPVHGQHRMEESPPEWLDDYPFDPVDPWDGLELPDGQSQPSKVARVRGPQCAPVRISEIDGLHYITPISNLESILEHGLLSHNRAQSLHHRPVADDEVNRRRAARSFVPGRTVHDYANLYFNARNPMLYRRLREYDRGEFPEALCVVRIAHTVLWRTNVLILDGNAASDRTRHTARESGMVMLDRAKVYADSWNSGDEAQRVENVRCIMAEALVPDQVPVRFIKGVFFRNTREMGLASSCEGIVPFEIRPKLFFR